MKSRVLEEDFREISKDKRDWQQFSGQSFLISGATGLIGSLLIKYLLYLNKVYDLDIKVTGLIRNKEKAENIYKDYMPNKNLCFIVHNLGSGDIKTNEEFDYIVHAAAITSSKLMISDPVGTIKTSVNGTEEMLDLAVKKHAKGMIYLSSMEAYGQPYISEKIKEQDLGYIDLSNPRSGYPESKRLCEALCNSYVSQYGLKVCSVRLAQTFGAGVFPTDNRVFAQFARSIMNNENIILHTEGKSEGNYVYLTDVIRAILLLLTNGNAGQAYNVTNEENHLTIREMAQLLIDNFGKNGTKVVIDIPKENMGYAPDVKMWLSSKKINELGWYAQINLLEMYRRLINYFKEMKIN